MCSADVCLRTFTRSDKRTLSELCSYEARVGLRIEIENEQPNCFEINVVVVQSFKSSFTVTLLKDKKEASILLTSARY